MKKKIKKFFSNIDFISLIYILTLLMYSLLALWSSGEKNTNLIYKRLGHILIGIITISIAAQINTNIYKKYIYTIYIISNLILIIVNTFGLISKGARRWINIGLLQFQPSEIIKIILPITISKIIDQKHLTYNVTILISIIAIMIPGLLVLIQPDLGTSILIIISGLTMLIFKRIKKKTILLLTIIYISLIPPTWIFILHNYQKQRILVLFQNDESSLHKKYHSIQSKIAIGSGGIYGKGFLQNTQSNLNFIPEKKTDFIFSLISEETGLIGIYILIITYILLIYRNITITINNKNKFNKELNLNFIFNFSINICINILMVNGILPIVGIPLPLISYGGSSLISNMFIFGIIMASKNKKII